MIANNGVGSVTSVVANLTIHIPARVKTQPSSQTVPIGGLATFKMEADGEPPLNFQWFRGSAAIPTATNTVLVLTNVQLSDGGRYKITVSNAFATVSSAEAVLTVNPPIAITVHPASQTVLLGSNATLSVRATGFGSLSYLWFRDGKPVFAAITPELKLTGVGASDVGDYMVRVTGDFGAATSSVARLVVNLPAAIRIQPQSQTVIAGNAARFSSQVDGTLPLSYRWFKDDVIITNTTNAALEFPRVQVANQGNYRFIVTNPFSAATSAVARLTVNAAPTIRIQPAGQTSSVSSNVSFMVEAEGTPPLNYQWFKNQDPVAGATNWILVLARIQVSDDAYYRVIVSNHYGAAESSRARLIIPFPPLISLQPLSQTARLGTSVSFSVEVEGTPPLSYQWLKDGEAISRGTNSTLTLNPITTGDAGKYAVVASNAFGHARSSEASLVIRTSPAVQGDFNRDDLPDIIFQDEGGLLALWHMTGPEMSSSALLNPSKPGEPQWRVVGVTDRNADRKPDLLFQHQSEGTLAVWFMEGAELSEARLLKPPRPGGSWRVVAP